MPRRCPDCHQRTSTRGRCPDCRAEHAAQGVDHDHDDAKTCAWCGRLSAAGHYARTGRWLCADCEREQLATLTDAADAELEAAVRWAVGGADPEADPGTLTAGFETAAQRVAADGGQQLCGYCDEPIDRDADDPPLTFEGEEIHWDCLGDAMEAADDQEWGVEQQGLGDQPAQGQATVDGGIARDGGDR